MDKRCHCRWENKPQRPLLIAGDQGAVSVNPLPDSRRSDKPLEIPHSKITVQYNIHVPGRDPREHRVRSSFNCSPSISNLQPPHSSLSPPSSLRLFLFSLLLLPLSSLFPCFPSPPVHPSRWNPHSSAAVIASLGSACEDALPRD